MRRQMALCAFMILWVSACSSGGEQSVLLPTRVQVTLQLQATPTFAPTAEITTEPNQPASPEIQAPPSPLPQVVGVPTPIPALADRVTFVGDILNGTPVSGELTSERDHLYRFEAQAGQYAQIEMSRTTGEIDPILTVYDPDGNPLAMDDDAAGGTSAILRNLFLPTDGFYSIQAGGDNLTGEYALRLLTYALFIPVTPMPMFVPTATLIPTIAAAAPTYAPAMMGQRLENHVPLLGTLQNADDVAIFTISAEAGDTFSVALSQAENSAFRGKVELVNPDGVVIGTAESDRADPNGDALIAALRAEIPGTYQVFITSINGATGAYIISYGIGSSREDVVRGELLPDQMAQADISRRGLRDLWTLNLNAGDIITAGVTAAAGSTLDPILEIAPVDDPENILAIDDNGGGGLNALINNVQIPAGGQYLLRVKAASAASTGGYALVWRYVDFAPTPTALPGIFPVLSVNDDVEDQAYRFYPFQGRAGQRVRIRVLAAAGSNFDPVAALLNPSGEVIAEADDSDGFNPIIMVELSADGTYSVRVNGYLAGGAFTVIVEEVF